MDNEGDEKQGIKSQISRGEIYVFKSWKSRGEREVVLQNLENREEKKIFTIKKSQKTRGEREVLQKSAQLTVLQADLL